MGDVEELDNCDRERLRLFLCASFSLFFLFFCLGGQRQLLLESPLDLLTACVIVLCETEYDI